MRGRSLRFAILAWMAFWFVAFLPAHQRGAIALDPSTAIGTGGCCASLCVPGEPATPEPTEAPASSCAVCHLVAKLDLAQPLNLSLAPLAPALDAVITDGAPLPSRPAEPQYLGRAPPIA